MAWALVGSVAAGEVAREYQLKAAFLYNFAKFVEWPAGTFAAADRPIVIGVFRANPFGDVLEKTVAGRKINGHPVVVEQVHTVAAARQMQILFVGVTQDAAVAALTESLKGSTVLTVGESAMFARRGGIITFWLQHDSLRFTINTGAAREAQLKISAQLQKLATNPEGNTP